MSKQFDRHFFHFKYLSISNEVISLAEMILIFSFRTVNTAKSSRFMSAFPRTSYLFSNPEGCLVQGRWLTHDGAGKPQIPDSPIACQAFSLSPVPHTDATKSPSLDICPSPLGSGIGPRHVFDYREQDRGPACGRATCRRGAYGELKNGIRTPWRESPRRTRDWPCYPGSMPAVHYPPGATGERRRQWKASP